MTQSRKQSAYNNFINEGENSNSSNYKTLAKCSIEGMGEDYNAHMSNVSSMTSNVHKVSGKVLQKKLIQLSDNSSTEFDN